MTSATPPSPTIPVSVCIITKDAAGQIGACVDSLAFADEVLVVDSGSTDGTQTIVEARGARLIHQTWLGFGRQKQFAVAAARHDWVLCLDADERVSPALAASIRAALTNADGPAYRVYGMPRRNRFLGRWLRYGEGYPDWSTRLFHRQYASWSNDPVHEAVITTSPIGHLHGDLLHESAEDMATYLEKQNRYSSLHAEALYAQGVRVGYVKLWLSPLVRFIKFYVFRRGFLDGGAGFAHIAIGCFSAFAKYAKLIERSQKNTD
jgi:glycosyltransferase involved in cell wall biosynthesis